MLPSISTQARPAKTFCMCENLWKNISHAQRHSFAFKEIITAIDHSSPLYSVIIRYQSPIKLLLSITSTRAKGCIGALTKLTSSKSSATSSRGPVPRASRTR